MTDFLTIVKNTITRHRLLRRDGKVIVALSGGADSVALLAVLVEAGYDCVAAHCNFHLRGDESNRDMRFAEEITARLNTDLYVKEFNVAEYMAEKGKSVEMACRELRYKWFFDLLDRDRAQAIAVGHHKEDQVETFFLNLLRGAGITGLAGMRYRAEHVVRPLLDVSRPEIENYLNERKLNWITDSSNLSDDFMRNRIRNRILPYLENELPGICDSVSRSMKILRENEGIYSDAVKKRGKTYINNLSGEIDIARLISSEPFPGTLLFEMLKDEGYNRRQTEDMLEAAGRSGGVFIAGTTHLRELDHGILRAPRAGRPSSEDSIDVVMTRDIFHPVRIEITTHRVDEFRIENNSNVAYIDEDALRGSHRWQIRRWHRGDRIIPYGMKGSKLLSDIFSDAHLSAEQKANCWILTRDEKIIWIIGIRASNHFTIGPSTKTYLRLELK